MTAQLEASPKQCAKTSLYAMFVWAAGRGWSLSWFVTLGQHPQRRRLRRKATRLTALPDATLNPLGEDVSFVVGEGRPRQESAGPVENAGFGPHLRLGVWHLGDCVIAPFPIRFP